MLRFNPPAEPENFDIKVRQPGNNWLVKNTDKKRPRDYWSNFKPDLADGFGNICGYSTMYEPVGTVDHFLSCEKHRHLAYEWSNYCFASGWINSSKGTLDNQILDPFEVENDWFEILLPSLQLIVTDKVPINELQKAEFTLEKLHLRDDERVLRQRQAWYQMYLDGEITEISGKSKAQSL
jgi:hypothetical protein